MENHTVVKDEHFLKLFRVRGVNCGSRINGYSTFFIFCSSFIHTMAFTRDGTYAYHGSRALKNRQQVANTS